MTSVRDARSDSNETFRDVVVECDFCTEVCRHCKLLPCLHVFCTKCLNDSRLTSESKSGNELHCPVCGKEFQNDSAINCGSDIKYKTSSLKTGRLVNTMSSSTVSGFGESGARGSAKVCAVCLDKSCKGCLKLEKAVRSSTLKANVSLRNDLGTKSNSMMMIAGNEGSGQTEKSCPDCKEILCVSCLKANRTRPGILETVKNNRDSFEKNQSGAPVPSSESVKKLELIDAERSEFELKIESLKREINSAREELKKLVDSHADTLILDVNSWEQEMAKIDAKDRAGLRAFAESSQRNISARGTSKDLISTAPTQMVSAELLPMSTMRIQRPLNSLHVFLKKTKLEDLLLAYDNNIVGVLKDADIPEFETKDDKIEHSSFGDAFRDVLANSEDPVLVRVLKTRSAIREDRGILGLTVLDDELYVVSRESSEVEVFDCTRLIFSCELDVNQMLNPEDITSCDRLKCLYIMDRRTSTSSNKILRVDTTGKLLRKWTTGEDWGHLSVTKELNRVLLAVYNKNRLREYTSQGQVTRIINISIENFDHPRHAMQLTHGQYVVSHGETGDAQHRVLVVDGGGKILKTFGENSNGKELKRPFYLETYQDDLVLVADPDNRRVLLLNKELEFKREFLSAEKHCLSYPVRICLDRRRFLLFVADNKVGNKHISVFKVKKPNSPFNT